MNWTLALLLFLIGCNSETPDLSSIQGVRDPGDPLPEIIHVAGPASSVYVLNDSIDFTVTFSEPVEVSGIPSLPLSLDSNVTTASYIAGSGTNTLIFRKTIISGEFEVEGISLNGKISLNGGSIKSHFDQDPSLLNFSASTLSGVQVNAINTTFVTYNLPADGLYGAGDNFCFDVRYSAPVNISSPLITLPFILNSTEYNAGYASGSGTDTLKFCWSVPAGVSGSGLTINPV